MTERLNWNDCDQCQLISHCSFYLHFSNNEWCWASFCALFGSLYAIYRETSIQIICSFSDWVVFVCFFFLILFYMSYLYVLKINPISVDFLINIFSHSVGFLFIFYGSLISPFKCLSLFFFRVVLQTQVYFLIFITRQLNKLTFYQTISLILLNNF